jgi:hypothetical protein
MRKYIQWHGKYISNAIIKSVWESIFNGMQKFMGKFKSTQLKLLKYMKSLNQEALDVMHNGKWLMGFQKLFGKKIVSNIPICFKLIKKKLFAKLKHWELIMKVLSTLWSMSLNHGYTSHFIIRNAKPNFWQMWTLHIIS